LETTAPINDLVGVGSWNDNNVPVDGITFSELEDDPVQNRMSRVY
jgi:hypothetical protein